MEPWHAPAPLKRAYCIKEVYVPHAGERRAIRCRDVLGAAGRARSGAPHGLRLDPDEPFQGRGLPRVQHAGPRLAARGVERSGAAVVLGRMPAAERGTSALTNSLGRLLMDMGKMEEARTLMRRLHGEERDTGRAQPAHSNLDQQHGRPAEEHGLAGGGEAAVEEALQAKRETLGDRHPRTLYRQHG
eukprot:scaffold47222_cov72-Phaeocystis_antarctica.AAC.4